MRLLLLEDDQETAEFVLRGFREEQHVVDHAKTGNDALMLATSCQYDAYILDRMVREPDGLTLLNMLRAGGDKTPALFLTAIGSVQDRVEGLQVADDYLVKPFAFVELKARVAALLRRPKLQEQITHLQCGDLSFDLLSRKVTRAKKPIQLQPTELRLLEYLLRHMGQVVTRTMLLEEVWDFHFDPKTNIVETHVSRLRSKIDKGFDKDLIKTVRGSGYIIDDEA